MNNLELDEVMHTTQHDHRKGNAAMQTDADISQFVEELKALLDELVKAGRGRLEQSAQLLDDIERIVRILRQRRPAPTFKH